MGDDDRKIGQKSAETEEAKKKEAWIHRNGPVVAVVVGVVLIALMGAAMKMCG
ncbi:MAG: hypothetical protein M0R80_11485 [Proteobacteria bacterium]|jgi:hypothetical protein|nr:hypothetical protein [Pseudomonadota bacterium]